MNNFTEFVNQVIRMVLRLVLFAAVAVFLLSLLMATLVVMLGVTVWALVTGRKPAPARVFSQFRQTSARYTQGAWPAHAKGRSQDIVDVTAHEVRDPGASADTGTARTTPPNHDPMARSLH